MRDYINVFTCDTQSLGQCSLVQMLWICSPIFLEHLSPTHKTELENTCTSALCNAPSLPSIGLTEIDVLSKMPFPGNVQGNMKQSCGGEHTRPPTSATTRSSLFPNW